MQRYRAVVIGCSRMGGFIDNEVAASPRHVPPYSHAAGYYACDRTDLVACADLRPDVMEQFGERYDIPKSRQYTDYKEMLEKEQPEIVSVATQPEPRAEIVIYAAEHGAKAIYAEKAMAASLAEADAMVEAIERNNVAFNLGTNRRWSPRYDKMIEVLNSGQLGALQTLVFYNMGTLFNTASHFFDLILRLNNDQPVSWVQAHLPNGDDLIDGQTLKEDPRGEGIIKFENGVTTHCMLTSRGLVSEAICERGSITALSDAWEWQLLQAAPDDPKGRNGWVPGQFPEVQQTSTTLRLIEDLVHALDTGEPPRGGVRVAMATMELIFGFIESHRNNGARIHLPVQERRMQLKREFAPRQPKLTA